MTLRSIPGNFCADALARIDAALTSIARDYDVRVLHAIESGSRAWGFPSPDSDYDCRFLFVRSHDDCLSLWPKRDVIELPLVDDMDVNGWDLAKALKLMLKGNAVVLEWLTSPIAYCGEANVRDELLALADCHVSRSLIGRHYLHLGEGQRRLHFGDPTAVPLKKLFYAIRPAAALRWLRLHPSQVVAPMHFPTLMAQCDPSQDVMSVVTDLMVRKTETRELGRAALPPAIAAFIDNESGLARDQFDGRALPISDAAKADADTVYRSIVGRQ